MNDQSDVMFVSGVRSYKHSDMIRLAKTVLATKGFFCVTNGRMPDAEVLLKEHGWELLSLSEKNKHERQRETLSQYLKTWFISTDKLDLNLDEVKERMEEYKKLPEYSFMNDPLKIHVYKSVRTKYGTTSKYPFFYSSFITPEIAEDIKKLLKKSFGEFIPEINPMTGETFQSVAEVNSLITQIKRGVI